MSGGLFVPGQFLKILALGADAVAIDSAILFAVTDTQALHAVPFEPPTQAAWYQGKYKDEFNIENGVMMAKNFLISSAEEIKMGLRAMGKRSLQELSKRDLISYDERIARLTGIPFSFHSSDAIEPNQ